MNKTKILAGIFSIVLISALLFVLRYPIMRAAGNFLIETNEFEFVATGFALSGQALDRGTEAANLLHLGKVNSFVCVGGNQSPDLQVFGSDLLESDLTKRQIDLLTDSSFLITAIPEGTSTMEESDVILKYCLQHGIDTCLIVSSLFHTKRVANVFKDKFKNEGIFVIVHGAPSSSYDEKFWWESEYGLLALNNEYIKLLYYFLKY